MIRAGYKCVVNGATITGTAPEKAAATISPSTAAQVISAGQYLTGDQTIEAVGGTAGPQDVIAGKTFSSSSGINQVGTATVSSLGGKKFAQITVNHVSGVADTITLPFSPSFVNFLNITTPAFCKPSYSSSFYSLGYSGTVANFALNGTTLTVGSGKSTDTLTFYIYE